MLIEQKILDCGLEILDKDFGFKRVDIGFGYWIVDFGNQHFVKNPKTKIPI